MVYFSLWHRLRRIRLDRAAKVRILAALGLIVLGSLVLGPSVPVFVFSEAPPLSVEWEVVTFYNNHIGARIGAILRITSVPGARVKLSNLPQVGDVVAIERQVPLADREQPDYVDRLDPFYLYPGDLDMPRVRVVKEGELEVRDRRVSRRVEDGLVVTEVYYDFQYLLPIDFEQAFTLKILPKVSVQQLFLLDSARFGVMLRSKAETAGGIDFYVARRVEEGSAPIFRFSSFNHPPGAPYYLRLAGAGILSGAVTAQLWVIAKNQIRKRWFGLGDADPEVTPVPTLVDLYIQWGREGDYGTFLEAVRLYRAGTWGKPSPRRWVESTFVLYSGVVLSESRVANFFTKLMEVADEPAV